MSEMNVSRRSFLGLGAVAALAAGTGLVGCAPQQGGQKAEAQGVVVGNAADVEWTKETDVVVVGFGGAGSAAAIEAKKAGVEVVLLEMLKNPGGSTLANGGFIMMGGTKLQEKFGLEDSPENFFAYLSAAAGENANQEAIKLICDKSPELYDWCVECGMDFESGQCDTEHHLGGYNAGFSLGYSGNEQSRNFAKAARPVPRGHMAQPGSSGKDMFAALSSTVESLGIEVLTETPGKQLVTDETGRVVGILAEGPDGELAIKARKAVIMTAGGFVDNEEMLNANYPFTNKRGPALTTAGNENGTGILMGQAIGATTFGMGCFQIGKTISTMGDPLAHGVLIDENARRIVAEDEYNSFIGRAIIMAPSSKCYIIFEDAYATEGDATKYYGEPLATADSIEELARAIGVNASVLESTVSFYNESAAVGEDREFGKATKYLSALENGPFHAFALGSETCYTASCGGLKIDLDAHVIDMSG
ncbi:MAG: FAD-dependent oxidoreductase, partial [Raoultibacter sp.]